ncbi:MAG: hypothetical protein IT368_04165 [Candidatus Hydrogenedentes bacterium]|nr:hypothetical protein [Candidatus Hydrogenedentota bacterium]
MITRGRVISFIAFLLLFGGMGGVYLFYFKDKLAAYALDEQKAKTFESRYTELADAFHGVDPQKLIPIVRGAIPAWQQAVEQRAQFFNFGDWFEYEEPPEGELLRFWYEEQAGEMLRKSQQAALEANPWLTYPQDLREMLQAPTLQDLTGQTVNEQDVREYLANLAFGLSAFDMLVENGATSISAIHIWPVRPDKLFSKRTVGMAFTMTLKDLTEMLDELRANTRFFDIDGLSLQHNYIAQNYEPQVSVELLLTQARFRQEASSIAAPSAGPGGAPGAPGAAGAPGMPGRPGVPTGAAAEWTRIQETRPPEPEPGTFAKAWKWIKRNIFYTN